MAFEVIVSVLLSIFAILFLAERANSKKECDSQSEEIAALKEEIAKLSAAALRQIKANNEAQNKQIDETSAALSNKISKLSQSLQQVIIDNNELKKENQELRKQLAFYTEIDAESEEINNTEDSKKTEELLESIDLGNEFAARDTPAPTDDGIYFPESGKSSESRILDNEQAASLSIMLNTNDQKVLLYPEDIRRQETATMSFWGKMSCIKRSKLRHQRTFQAEQSLVECPVKLRCP